MVVSWVRGHYRPHHSHPFHHPPAHLHVFVTVLVLVAFITSFVCIFYYVRGRNWARIAVLLTSILAILSFPFQSNRVLSAVWSLLGAFFLYWLNTRSVREFFKRPRPLPDKLT
jgi:hypothetical protein